MLNYVTTTILSEKQVGGFLYQCCGKRNL